MSAGPVEWVLVIFYGPSAHRATYGRLDGQNTKYTKDYIQLSRKAEFLEVLGRLFPTALGGSGSVPLTYQWPRGSTPGTLVFNSADRPHLKWETNLGAPQVWRMSLTPSETAAETIPGDPSHLEFEAAENELFLLTERGAGQPYLVAIKLRDEPDTLHLRVYLKNPSRAYAWADIGLVPRDIQVLTAETSQHSALAWSIFNSGGKTPNNFVKTALTQLDSGASPISVVSALDSETKEDLGKYLRSPGYGVHFDSALNHGAWLQPAPLSEFIKASVDELLEALQAGAPVDGQGDAAAEKANADPNEVQALRRQIEQKNYEVANSKTTVNTRGSAQRAFAESVKSNYGYRCAITGIATRDFLVAAHIVPWSDDQSIRLDPSNGICLSLLVDRAFENGHLQIDDDLSIRIDWTKVGEDVELRAQLSPYDGKRLRTPSKESPQVRYLQRRRAVVS